MDWATEHGPRRCQFVALERSRFRKNRSIKLILITRLLRRIVCGTNKPSRSELEHGQTDRHCNPRCTCAPRVNKHPSTQCFKWQMTAESKHEKKNTLYSTECFKWQNDRKHETTHWEIESTTRKCKRLGITCPNLLHLQWNHEIGHFLHHWEMKNSTFWA